MHSIEGLEFLVTFHDLGLVGERFSPLSLGLGFMTSLSFRSDSRSQVQCSFTLYLFLIFGYLNAYISYVAYLANATFMMIFLFNVI